MSNDALTVMEPGSVVLAEAPKPREQIAYATEIANELANIIRTKKLSSKIQGKEYVAVEGWTTLAALRGCTPIEVSNEDIGGGVYVAVVELLSANGRVIGRASAECGAPDEVDRNGNPVWANRPAYARRSMANTRATSKVCRQVFAWVMALTGYATTPAEEVPSEGFAQNAPKSSHNAPQGDSGAKWDGSKEVFFGKYSKEPDGPKTWAELPSKYLDWIVENMDPEKGPACKMAQQEVARRALVEAGTVHEGEVLDFGDEGHDELNPPPPEEL